jgi:hypothetical protein
MKRIFIAAFLFVAVQLPAQSGGRTCGTPILPQQFETWLQGLTSTNQNKNTPNTVQSVFNIPVIVHVIHNNEAVNSSNATSGNNLNAAQILDQINILNRDFNGTNADSNLIPQVFKPSFAKLQVNFCLAVVNPTGGILAEPGIDRINRVAKGWTATPYSQTYIDATVKPNSIWDPNRYLNIWVCPLSNGLLGYATFPNPGTSGLLGLTGAFGSTTTDGIVNLNTAFGSIGTAQFGVYNRGRTATHEIGHWIGLRHIWGDGTCATDYCNDTPPAQNSNFGCPNFPYKLGTCTGNTNGEMTMNFMDYTNDACMYMFTADQKVRAQLIMSNSTMRANLVTSTVCNLPTVINDPGISNIVSPTYSQVISCPAILSPIIKLTNYAVVTLTSAVFAFNVNGVNTQTVNWTGSLSPNTSSTISLPQVTVGAAGQHNYSVNVSSPNGGADANLLNNSSVQSFSVSTGSISVTSGTTCPGVPVIISASGAAGFIWNTGATTNTIAANPLVTTIYTVTAVPGSCAPSKTVVVTVNPFPLISVNNQAACVNTTITITGSGANSYTWSTGSLNASTSLNLLATTVLTVTGFNSSVCFTNKVFTVTANPEPTVSLNANYLSCAVCSDGTVSANVIGGAAPYTYTWLPNNLNAQQLLNVTAGTYTVVVADAFGCVGTDSLKVGFNVGINKYQKDFALISVSPNPYNGLYRLNNNERLTIKVTVIDALGRVVKQFTSNLSVFEIDLSSESKGLYYLQATTDYKQQVIKLLKE